MSARHPGPAEAIASALPRLRDTFDVVVVATDGAARVLLARHTRRLSKLGVELWVSDVGSTGHPELRPLTPDAWRCSEPAALDVFEFETRDVVGASNAMPALERAAERIAPDVLLRTTPSGGIGIDELLPAALRNCGYRGPLLAFQDYYSVGAAMVDGEHPVGSAGVDAVATIDVEAARLLSHRVPVAVEVVGWVAHDQYLHGLAYDAARTEGRRLLGIGPDDRLLVYAGIATEHLNDALNEWRRVVSAVDRIAARRGPTFVDFLVHPRMVGRSQLWRRELAGMKRAQPLDLRPLPSFRHLLAVPDVLMSAASAINIDALAYSTTSGVERDGLVSVYTVDCLTRRTCLDALNMPLPPTHRHGRGSVVVSGNELEERLEDALFDPEARARLRRAARMYRPDGRASRRLARFVEGARARPRARGRDPVGRRT